MDVMMPLAKHAQFESYSEEREECNSVHEFCSITFFYCY